MLKDPESRREFCRKHLGINWWSNIDRQQLNRRVGGSVRLPFHKGIEVELEHDREPWSSKWYFMNRITDKQDHAGFFLDISLLGFGFDFKFYDGRHWDTKRSCWYKAEEEAHEIDDDKRKTEELETFVEDPANASAVVRKLLEYFNYISISDRAFLHEHFLGAD